MLVKAVKPCDVADYVELIRNMHVNSLMVKKIEKKLQLE